MSTAPGDPEPRLTRRQLRQRADAAGDPPAAADPAELAVPQPWQPPTPVAPEPWTPLIPPPSGPRYHSAPVYPGMPGYAAPAEPLGHQPGPHQAGWYQPGPYQPGPYQPDPYGQAGSQPASNDHGPGSAMHWMLPVGRSWQSVVAGYLGLFSLLLWPLGVVAIGLGVWALVLAHRGGHGTGRAITGIVGGLVGVAALAAFLTVG